MDYTPERIWATGTGETGSWNAIEGRMKSHMPDGWQTEYVRATDYDALVAKLADAERVARYESDVAQQAIDQIKADKARAEAAEAAIREAYWMGLGAGAIANAKVQAVTKYLGLMLLHVQHERFARGHGETEPADSGKLVDEARAALSALEENK